eukprot:TRINITY_DN971_c0_g1_i2.p2 TRINITY_DN971_c0_g1~~TRINITY_DN971_c0_g1_i2.p2  ORF type:complete len:266 (+),score=104.23 TRINITY_DN971_c0_g1_i2:60-857(+)
MRGVTMTKVVGICFGLFALMAISTSTGSRQQAEIKVVKAQEKELGISQVNTINIPEGAQGTIEQTNTASEPATQANTVNTIPAVAVSSVSKKHAGHHMPEPEADAAANAENPANQVNPGATTAAKDVHVSISINVHKQDQDQVKPVVGIEEPKQVKQIVEKQAAVAEQVAAVEKPVLKEIELPVETKAAVVEQPKTKVVRPASASVLVIPLLAIAAVLVAVKVRKPGYLPEAVEEKLESMGFPAQQKSSFNTWKSSPSRSMYGSV